MRRFFRKAVVTMLSLGVLLSGIQTQTVSAAGITKPEGFVSAYNKYGTVKIAKDPSTGYQQLCAEDGTPVQLKGMSTFGLQWDEGNWVLNDAAFDALAYDWKCDIVRLAMYVAEGGYATDPATNLARVEKGIQMATERGMYVLADWHMLEPGDPTDSVYTDAGKDLPEYAEIRAAHPEYTGPQLFFAYLSQKYGNYGNLLFEIANEPVLSGGDQSELWKNKLRPYHQSVVEAIREYDKDSTPNIVICGTNSWSQTVDVPTVEPVTDPSVTGGLADCNQIMYTLHFYAATHFTSEGESKIQTALNGGIAVFVTEWGTVSADGNGAMNKSSSDERNSCAS